MVMRDFIKDFPNQIEDAVNLSSSLDFGINQSFILNEIQNIVISGQGGSGIGGVIVKNLVKDLIPLPIVVNNDYSIPSFVGDKTLFIASSYSGNTEETISALNKVITLRDSGVDVKVFCICSGGQLLDLAQKKDLQYILIPSGGVPRAMLSYSVIQMLLLITQLVDKHLFFQKTLIGVKDYLFNHQKIIMKLADEIVKQIGDKMPFIYTSSEFEGVALRFKQQLNENSKRHATYNVIPEMNHNEIVAWNHKNICVAPVFINGNTHIRNKERLKINLTQIKDKADTIVELSCGHEEYFYQYFYFIHLLDWVSVILAEKEGVDPNNIDAIDYLKKELKKI